MEDGERGILKNGENGKLSWIFKNGLRAGHVCLLFSLLIMVVPLVLPLLMLISAFVIACAVPYGMFLTTYVCAKKLMNILLPLPTTNDTVSQGLLSGGDDEGTTESVRESDKDTRKDINVENNMKNEDMGAKEKQRGGLHLVDDANAIEEMERDKGIDKGFDEASIGNEDKSEGGTEVGDDDMDVGGKYVDYVEGSLKNEKGRKGKKVKEGKKRR